LCGVCHRLLRRSLHSRRFWMKLFAAVGNIECSKVETFLVPTRIAFAKEALGRGHMPVVQAIAFGLYGFFVNINKFNKAMAMMLFTLFGLIFRVPRNLQRLVRWAWERATSCSRTVRVHWALSHLHPPRQRREIPQRAEQTRSVPRLNISHHESLRGVLRR
jgi:hypothetical protein